MKVVITFHILCCVSVAYGFFPNHYKFKLNGNDFTHREITEMGILRSVAKYFEENPKCNATLGTGALSKLPNLSARVLYDQYYGVDAPTSRFQEAMNDIVKNNNDIDLHFHNVAEWHFNAELIEQGMNRLQKLRQNILSILTNKQLLNFDAARHLIGQYLYLLQSFYSNTNWIEMNAADINSELGSMHRVVRPTSYLPPDASRCTSCGPIVGSNCTGNILIKLRLTSGYRSGQDITKPYKDPAKFNEGKCSHGGELDLTSSSSAALGGINKDTSSERLSPHYELHQKAAEMAIAHTDDFFSNNDTGLRHLIGESTFRELLQLETSTSLVFVVDTTGSMSNDITAVRQKTREIVEETRGTDLQPYKYILVEFNDPASLTKTRITKSSQQMMTWLSGLSVHGGGDCPEFSMTGIKQAAVAADPNSIMYVFTDASAKDLDQYTYAESLIRTKNLKVEFLVTGDCGRRKRGSGPQTITMSTPAKRAYTYSNLDAYHKLAELSDGAVFESSKSDISTAVDVIKETLKGSFTPVGNGIIGPGNAQREMTISVDSTVSELSIRVQSDLAYVRPALYRPDGSLEEFDTFQSSFRDVGSKLIYITIQKPMDGTWRLVRTEETEMTVDVTSVSSVDFSVKFLQDGHDNYTDYEIEGNPIIGRDTAIIVSVPQIDKLASVDNITILTTDGQILTSKALTQGQGHASRYLRSEITVPSKPFFVQVSGMDKSGHVFRRRSPQPFTPTDLELEILDVYGDLSSDSGLAIVYKVTLQNGGTSGVVDINVNADGTVSGLKTKTSMPLSPGESVNGSFTISTIQGSSLVRVTLVATRQISTSTGSQFRVLWIDNPNGQSVTATPDSVYTPPGVPPSAFIPPGMPSSFLPPVMASTRIPLGFTTSTRIPPGFTTSTKIPPGFTTSTKIPSTPPP